jgi:RNA polymerase sigma-70 factor (ECF subfamily)
LSALGRRREERDRSEEPSPAPRAKQPCRSPTGTRSADAVDAGALAGSSPTEAGSGQEQRPQGAVDPNDEVLLERVRRRDAAALGALYDRHHQVALAVALRLLRDPQLAEDAVQDAYLALWRGAATYRGERGTVRSWLLSIVHHRCVDHLRQLGRQRGGAPVALEATMVDTTAPDVPEQALGNIRQDRVRQALLALPDEQRQAVQLAYFGGLSCQQIAERTQVPLGTVKGRMRLALQKLRRLLRTEGLGELGEGST